MKNRNRLAKHTLVALLSFPALVGCSDDKGSPTVPAPAQTAEEFLEDRGFQGTVLIHRAGETVLERGFGYADRSAESMNDVETKYRIGSVTKSFTAAAMFQLKKDGLIANFDQTVAEFFPEFPRGDEITIRHLLTHQSGLPDYLGGYVDESSTYDPEELVESVMGEPLGFDPGEFVQYSNTNYAALGVLIEELTGMDYMSYLEAAVLGPLDLRNTEYGIDPIQGPEYAKGYVGSAPARRIDMSVPYAAGALVSTVSDLGVWAGAMLGKRFLSAEERAEMFPEPHGEPGVNVLGMGWFVLNAGSQTVIHHGGDIAGFTSLVALYPEENGYLVLLSNVQDQHEIRVDLMDHLVTHGLR